MSEKFGGAVVGLAVEYFGVVEGGKEGDGGSVGEGGYQGEGCADEGEVCGLAH